MESNELRRFNSLYLQAKAQKIELPKEKLEEIKDIKLFDNFRKKISFDINNKFSYKFINCIGGTLKRVIIVYHKVDIDGLGVKVLAEITGKIGGFKDIIYLPCNKRADEAYEDIKKNLPDYDLCIIADLNFTEEYADKVNDELDTDKIILLDHHVHATYLNKEDWAYISEHDIYNYDLSSGTILFYSLIESYINYILIKRKDYDDDMIVDLMTQLENFTMSTAAHDTWFAHDVKTTDLSLEIFNKVPLYLSLLHKSYKEEYANKLADNILYGYKLIDSGDLIMCDTTDKIIQSQCTFMWYNCKINKMWYKEKLVTVATCYVTQYSSEIGNYILKKQPEIDFVVMINPNVNSVSLRSRTDEFDVVELVQPLKGGGHQAASGYTIADKTFFNLDMNTIVNDLLHGPEKFRLKSSFGWNPIKDYDYDKESNTYVLDEITVLKYPEV